MIVEITRKIEFDAGHRIPDHNSKCRNVHGHRYVLEATVRGDVNPVRGQSDDGMVVDFGDLKGIMLKAVGDVWDHAFLVYERDTVMLLALSALGDAHRSVLLPVIPTVENLASHAFSCIQDEMPAGAMKLHRVRLWETPNCWCDCTGED